MLLVEKMYAINFVRKWIYDFHLVDIVFLTSLSKCAKRVLESLCFPQHTFNICPTDSALALMAGLSPTPPPSHAAAAYLSLIHCLTSIPHLSISNVFLCLFILVSCCAEICKYRSAIGVNKFNMNSNMFHQTL